MNKLYLFLLLMLPYSSIFSQSSNNHSAFTLGAGIGMSDGNTLMGSGPQISIGFHKTLKYSRLSFHPELSIGFYGARFITDVPDMYFNSINLDFNFWFDLIRVKGLALTIGAAPVINQRKGLIGTGGYPPGNEYSEYTKDSQFLFKFGGGIKIMPPNQKIIVQIFPLNFRLGGDYFMEGFAMIHLGYRI